MQSQYHINNQGYQLNSRRNEITKNQLTNFIPIPITAESLQMTMSSKLMGESFLTSNKPLMVLTGTDIHF